MSRYFMMQDGKQAGPFTAEELAQRLCSSSTLVWQRGMEQWTPAASVPELASLLPPPMPMVAPAQPTAAGPSTLLSPTLLSVMSPWLGAKFRGLAKCSVFILIGSIIAGASVHALLSQGRPESADYHAAATELSVVTGIYLAIAAIAAVLSRDWRPLDPGQLQLLSAADRLKLETMEVVLTVLTRLVVLACLYRLWHYVEPRLAHDSATPAVLPISR